MDRKQLKVLVEIRDTGKYDYTTDPDWKVSIIHYLAKSGYIYYDSEDLLCIQKLCIISEEGKSAIYEWYKERRSTRLSLFIAIFAAIGGYREELALVIQALKQLWRSITGG